MWRKQIAMLVSYIAMPPTLEFSFCPVPIGTWQVKGEVPSRSDMSFLEAVHRASFKVKFVLPRALPLPKRTRLEGVTLRRQYLPILNLLRNNLLRQSRGEWFKSLQRP